MPVKSPVRLKVHSTPIPDSSASLRAWSVVCQVRTFLRRRKQPARMPGTRRIPAGTGGIGRPIFSAVGTGVPIRPRESFPAEKGSHMSGIEMNFAAKFCNDAWQADLRKIASLKHCQFPASTEIKICGTHEQVTIMMTKKGLLANMQTDAAAFEAWALALLLHCGVQSIQIGLDTGAEDAEGRHYQRYLYRLKRFCDLFPGRVIAAPPAAAARALDPHVKRLLNKPNPRNRPPDTKSKERLLTASAALSGISESLLESANGRSGCSRNESSVDLRSFRAARVQSI
jgi:hypothetical protein